MEPLLSVTWLWPEGWSLGLRSRGLGADPWGETERLRGSPPTPTAPAGPPEPWGTLWAAAGRGAVVLGLRQGGRGRGGRQRRRLLALGG